jgi:BirA family transcriptional regulator, biotin operon repressor / biotin---[acetyl-CoA-carboxylase] ligase
VTGRALGRPRLHLRETSSTSDRARRLAIGGAPHGTLVTAGFQTAGRGRQGRAWIAPAGRALLLSLIVRPPVPLLSLRAGLAVADLAGQGARVKWPNDVLLEGRKVAGVLVEARPQDGWGVVGIGVNAALSDSDFPAELRDVAGTLGRSPEDIEATLEELLAALERRLDEPADAALEALQSRDALLDRPVAWSGGRGIAAGIDPSGGLRIRRDDGRITVLEAGEVHLGSH